MKRHFEDSALISSRPNDVFNYIDDHMRFSSHMTKSSWMMGGSSMKIDVDEGNGQKVGSHIRMSGKVFGINLYLDEVVTKREPPRLKVWETVGSPKLLVIGSYQMGFEINPQNGKSSLKVFIDYDLPLSNRWMGLLSGGMYAKWCVRQMIKSVRDEFNTKESK